MSRRAKEILDALPMAPRNGVMATTSPVTALAPALAPASAGVNDRWTTDVVVESVLKEVGVSWTLAVVPRSKINYEVSKLNRGRISDKLDPDRVLQYGLDMRNGDRFPMLLLNDLGDGTYSVLGGMHRDAGALDAKIEELGAYVVKVTDAMLLDFIPMQLNIRHGNNVPDDDRYSGAIHMIQKHGFDKKDAAKHYRIPYKVFLNHILSLEVANRLTLLGIDGALLAKGVLLRLNTIASDKTLASAGALLTSFKLDSERSMSFIAEVNSARSEMDAMKVLVAWHETLKDEKAAGGPGLQGLKRRSKDVFFRQLSAVINKMHDTSAYKLQVTSAADKERVRNELKKILRAFNRVFGIDLKKVAEEAMSANAKSEKDKAGEDGGKVKKGAGAAGGR